MENLKFTNFFNEKGDYTIVFDQNGEHETIVGYIGKTDMANNACQELNSIIERVRAKTSNENGALPIPDVSGSLPDYVDCMNKAFERAYKIEEVEEIGGDILHIYENDIAKLIDYCRGKRQ